MTQFIVISGIDGSGKTTLIQALRARLEREGLTTRYEWMRYNHRLVRPIHGLSRLIGLSRRYQVPSRPCPGVQGPGQEVPAPVRNKRIWRHEFYRSALFSSFYIRLTWLDAWLGRLMLAGRLMFRRVDVVICDRWVPDVLVDLTVDTRRRGLLCGTWYSRFLQILPPGARQYLVLRDPRRIASSRPEVQEDMSLAFRRRLYRRLGRSAGVVVVSNNGTVAAAVETILSDWKSCACRYSS